MNSKPAAGRVFLGKKQIRMWDRPPIVKGSVFNSLEKVSVGSSVMEERSPHHA